MISSRTTSFVVPVLCILISNVIVGAIWSYSRILELEAQLQAQSVELESIKQRINGYDGINFNVPCENSNLNLVEQEILQQLQDIEYQMMKFSSEEDVKYRLLEYGSSPNFLIIGVTKCGTTKMLKLLGTYTKSNHLDLF
jgi:hypothetical protein